MLESQDDTLDAGGESRRGGRRPTQHLGQHVVPAAAANGVLCADALGPHLEDSLCIIIQAAHHPVVQGVRTSEIVQVAPQRGKMFVAFAAQRVRNGRRVLDHRLALGLLAVQHPQRVLFQPLPALLTNSAFLFLVIRGELIEIAGTTLAASDAVDLETEIAEPQRIVEMPRHGHDLKIDGRIKLTQRFDVELRVLAEPARLGALVTEHRPPRPDLHRLGQAGHPVLDVRADYARREFGPQRHEGAALVLERVHLLVDDVGPLAHTPLEQGGFLEYRQIDPLVSIQLHDLPNRALHEVPVGLLLRQHILHALRRLKRLSHHKPSRL